MIDLLVAVRPADRITDCPSPVDLREILSLSEVQDRTRLWFDTKGKLIAFALVDHYSNLRFEINQQDAHPDTEAEIITWAAECMQRRMQKSGETLTLDASCREDDTKRIALLERNGFVMREMRSIRMIRSLDSPIPSPRVPPGFTICHVEGEHEARSLVALHRAAFGSERMTVDERLAMNVLTGLQEGYPDPLVTHPDFQQRGLARALLRIGLQKLKQRGIQRAFLGTISENVAMQRTAQSVGFQLQSTMLWFEKQVL